MTKNNNQPQIGDDDTQIGADKEAKQIEILVSDAYLLIKIGEKHFED